MKRTILAVALATMSVAAFAGDRVSASSEAVAVTESSSASVAASNNAGNAQNVTLVLPATPEQRETTTTRQVVSGGTDSTVRNVQSGETVQHVIYGGTQTIKNVPGVVVSGPASGPCNGLSGGIGVAVPGMGVGANFSKVDEGCEERETARIAALMGRMDIANTIIENTEVYQRALERKAKNDEKKAKAAAAAQSASVARSEEAVATPVALNETISTVQE